VIEVADRAVGEDMYGWARDLFPIPRSLTGPGVRETLAYLKALAPGLEIREIASGTPVFDWTAPDEWTLRQAYIEDESGRRIVDAARCNLHVVGYSTPIDAWLEREDLDAHLHSLPDQPDAIPYITSYYARRWGFCLTHRQRVGLPPGRYRVVVDADLKPGVMNYGELILPGLEPNEVLLSTYVCHPSMANNELSGPVVTTALARWLAALPQRRFTYRILFLPETIGAIAYLSRHLRAMKAATVAGFVVTCVGDTGGYSYLASRHGDTLADRVARHVLAHHAGDYRRYSFLERGSDERQYCAPGIDLPVCSILRSKYGEYPEYHTSLDDLSFISPEGLAGAYGALKGCLQVLEANRVWRTTTLCEPQLGKRGLYPTLSTKASGRSVRTLTNILAYADGGRDVIALADTIGEDARDCIAILKTLADAGLVEVCG
jgi:aminopeptidase-like protein